MFEMQISSSNPSGLLLCLKKSFILYVLIINKIFWNCAPNSLSVGFNAIKTTKAVCGGVLFIVLSSKLALK